MDLKQNHTFIVIKICFEFSVYCLCIAARKHTIRAASLSAHVVTVSTLQVEVLHVLASRGVGWGACAHSNVIKKYSLIQCYG
jgi:hypothetical protein